jgi:hypothetical protein
MSILRFLNIIPNSRPVVDLCSPDWAGKVAQHSDKGCLEISRET